LERYNVNIFRNFSDRLLDNSVRISQNSWNVNFSCIVKYIKGDNESISFQWRYNAGCWLQQGLETRRKSWQEDKSEFCADTVPDVVEYADIQMRFGRYSCC
jgi:hypothetical protein